MNTKARNVVPDEGSIVVDDLHVGLTRSAVVYGVPVKPALWALMVIAIIFVATMKLFTLLLVFPVLAILRLITATNPRIFAEVAAWSRVNMRCQNRFFWRAASFSPRGTRKWENHK